MTVDFTIYDRSDDAPVGTVGLFKINYVHSNAELGIAIGDRRGYGLGTEATRLTVQWAFRTLGLRNVMLGALAWNEGALRAYERAGFRRIGVRRAARDEPRRARRRRVHGHRSRGPRLKRRRAAPLGTALRAVTPVCERYS